MLKTLVCTELAVDERLIIKKNVLGSDPGPRVCLVTGTHGDELEGQYVLYQIARTLNGNLSKLHGTVEIYPALNPLGIDTIERGVPGFDLDMNRIFPGSSEGTMAENAAFKIIEDLRGANIVIDIHSSNLFLREVMQARINELTQSALIDYAKMLNLDFIWVHPAATVLESTLAHSLNMCGTACVVVEMGVGMRINESLGDRLVNGILNLLHQLGMYEEEAPEPLSSPRLCSGDSVSFINAPCSGMFITRRHNGAQVAAGELLGEIVSPLEGSVLAPITAPKSGFLFTIRAYPVVYEGSLIARIALED